MIKRCTGKATKIRFLSIQKNKEKTIASYTIEIRNTETQGPCQEILICWMPLLPSIVIPGKKASKCWCMIMSERGKIFMLLAVYLYVTIKVFTKILLCPFQKNKTSTSSSMIYGGIINNNNNFLLEKKGQTQFWPTRIFICFPTIKVLTLDFKKKMTGIF